MGTRTQIVSGLDPQVLKNGSYTWQAPVFSVGKESNTVNNTSTNKQFMEIGSIHGGPASKNVMYTQDFYLYSKGKSPTAIIGQPINNARSGEILPKARTNQVTCNVDGLWGAGGGDPYRTITGKCQGSVTTSPAGPNLDYVYGSYTLPTIHTPWTATPTDHCFFPKNKKQHTGCVNASIALTIHYQAQKIRVPIDNNVTLFAEAGTSYRRITPHNLRYVCKSNVYLKGILPTADCLTKSYLPGSASYTYFAVGYEYKTADGTVYTAQYTNIPGQENGDKLAWLDASNTQLYSISASKTAPQKIIKENLQKGLSIIKHHPAIYNVLGNNFLLPILKKNKLS
jgi:hypothetical protein